MFHGGHEGLPEADTAGIGDPRAFPQVNETEMMFPYTEGFDHVPATAFYLEELPPDDDELQLWQLSNLYGYGGYPVMGDGFVADEYGYRPGPYEPRQHRAYSSDPLVDSLAHFLGTPEDNWQMSDHRVGEEIDFGDVWELDAVRQIGKEANVPQYLVDSVDPEADENLLELMVRIAENPEKWRSIHSAIERLDQAAEKLDESYERKDIEKRSSPYQEHYHPHKEMSHTKRKKLAMMKKRKKKKHEWEEGPERPYADKIRHDHRKEEYGSSFEKPKSAAYASVVFPSNENQNFERWKVRYQPVEPEDVEGGVPKDYKHPKWPTRTSSDYNRYAKKKLKMKAMVKEAKEKEKSAADLRRWQVLKFNKHLVDKWSKVKDLKGQEAASEEKHEDAGMTAKEKSLATNNWVTPKEHKENWPHFAYHRVTSSPSVQQRDAGAQPRHRSAYVAVSVVPTNSTGAVDSKPHPSEPHHKQNKLPDLFDHVLDEQEKAKSLKEVEDKFHMGDSERLRLQQVMRDASNSSNRTT
ncbi:UNVERIFIED_CONTAM: hypothetical protein PYX00_007067 [Menopon gallinae]|uniref:Uncharacterized protein n=1 Tax=Menopon gallinae TaxID=328185 RepID=A0AAW2HH87_9NEOP